MASAFWKKVSWNWPSWRECGLFGFRPRARWARSSSQGTICCMASYGITIGLLISCEVRKPSKKFMKGTEVFSVAMWLTSAMSIVCCTLLPARIANPVCRVAITSVWSPKMHSACLVIARAATWKTSGFSAPAMMYMLGTMSSSPWEDVNVVTLAPTSTTPWHAPAAPASDCICVTSQISPKRFLRPAPAQFATQSPMAVAGVMG